MYRLRIKIVWLELGLLCAREHCSPCRHEPVLKKNEQFTLSFSVPKILVYGV
jgi:hypothetical protein